MKKDRGAPHLPLVPEAMGSGNRQPAHVCLLRKLGAVTRKRGHKNKVCRAIKGIQGIEGTGRGTSRLR